MTAEIISIKDKYDQLVNYVKANFKDEDVIFCVRTKDDDFYSYIPFGDVSDFDLCYMVDVLKTRRMHEGIKMNQDKIFEG